MYRRIHIIGLCLLLYAILLSLSLIPNCRFYWSVHNFYQQLFLKAEKPVTCSLLCCYLDVDVGDAFSRVHYGLPILVHDLQSLISSLEDYRYYCYLLNMPLLLDAMC
jgi:hypothetical protein